MKMSYIPAKIGILALALMGIISGYFLLTEASNLDNARHAEYVYLIVERDTPMNRQDWIDQGRPAVWFSDKACVDRVLEQGGIIVCPSQQDIIALRDE